MNNGTASGGISVTDYTQQIEKALGDKAAIVAAEPRKRTVLAPVARTMGRKAMAAAIAEVMREALAKLIAMTYQETSDGRLWNIGYDGRIEGIVMPWSDAGYKTWGLRRMHARTLQHAMVRRQGPFVFNREDTCWYLDLDTYPTMAAALTWLDSVNLNAERWLELMNDFEKYTTEKRAAKAKARRAKRQAETRGASTVYPMQNASQKPMQGGQAAVMGV